MIEIVIHWLRLGGGIILALFFGNVSEALVEEYTLPQILVHRNAPIISVEEWEELRRPEILALFEKNVYGSIPKDKPMMSVEILEEGAAFDGVAYRKQVRVTLTRAGMVLPLQLLIYTPSTVIEQNVRSPGFAQSEVGIERQGFPVVISYNLEGNHTIHTDEKIIPSKVYAKRIPGAFKDFNVRERGKRSERLPVEQLVKEGYAVVTVYYGDVDPDYNDGFKNGAHALYPELEAGSWGSIGAWAWGFSRVVDYVETEEVFDSDRVVIFGFSRLGKSALWAAANDQRFGTVIVDSPGEGGAALSKRNYGENIFLMTLRFPHWFVSAYRGFSGNEEELPVDQHMLLALVAPQSLLVSSSDKDYWSDFVGEKIATEEAQVVYRLYDSSHLAHVLHKGRHEVTKDEWDDYLLFLKEAFQ